MNKFSIVLMFVLAFCCVGFSSTGLPTEISNIHFENVTQTSVDVVWTTVHPSTSQVVLSNTTDGGEDARQIPVTADPAMVRAHRVTVDHLVPYAGGSVGQYYAYVASVTAAGQMSTAPGPHTDASSVLLSMRTLPTDFAGIPNLQVYATGPTTIYTGHDTYLAFQMALISGKAAHLYIQSTGGYNNGTDGVVSPAAPISVHYACRESPAGLDSGEQWYDTTQKSGFCYLGNTQVYHSIRLRVPANTTPGPYTLTVTLISNGQTVLVKYPFTVVKTPTSVVSLPKTPTAIPGLATWEAQMDTLGSNWCANRDLRDAAGSFESFGYEQDDWFYDGGRVFEQIDDYKANVLNQPNHAYWQHCSQAVLYPYAYYLAANNGHMQGWRIFPYGMMMNYWRTHNPVMMDAVNKLATTGTYSGFTGKMDPAWTREMSYSVNMWIANAQLGYPVSPLLQKNVDKLISMLQMGAEGNGSMGASNHPFMVGIEVETLSRWYNFSVAAGTPDYRVIPVVKAALDVLWATNWQPNIGTMNYDRLQLPVRSSDDSVLNNLNSQGYAWLWYMTGDDASRQHAYDLFSHAFQPTSGFDWNGKEFSQNFEFSFDTVSLLQNNGLSYTDAASNSFGGPWPVTTPPQPTNVNCSSTCASGTIASDRATITWTTYVLASTQVVYGTTTAYGQQTVLSDTQGVLSHTVTLTGLLPTTKYHFRAKSVDMFGNPSQTIDLTFTTP